MHRQPGMTLTLVGLLSAIPLLSAGAQDPADDFRPRRVARPFPAITEFPTKPVKEITDELNPSELMLGVTIKGESRAYPINMLTGPRREILNDTLGGKHIAATW